MFFKSSIDSVAQAMICVSSSKSLEFSTRSLAMEILVTLSETAPALVRRSDGLIPRLVPLAMSLMLEADEEEAEWVRGKYSEDAVDDEFLSLGDEAIERIAAGLGGKWVSDLVLNICQAYSTQSHWTSRRAAVAGVCRLAEGSTKHFKQYFDHSLTFLTAAAQDSSPRVQYEAIQVSTHTVHISRIVQ